MIMEVCVDSVLSAVNAESGGAKRLELCSSLLEGGLTPSVGMLRVVKKMVAIPVVVMIRPRAGDFLFSDEEFEVMQEDVKSLKAAGADGIAIGILNSNGTVDTQRCSKLVDLARPMPVTFHRAIDMTHSVEDNLESVIALGCERLLTSGGEATALEGAYIIAKLIQQADNRIIIMPGGGITDRNLLRILETTGAKEFHASARDTVPSSMQYQNHHVSMGGHLSPPEFSLKVTSSSKVKSLLNIAKGIY